MPLTATTTTPQPPERIHGWLDSQLSLARHYGGLTLQGHHYIIAYDEPGQPLVRSDIKSAEVKAAKKQKLLDDAKARREQAAAQAVLHLPSDETEGGSHD